MDTPAQKSGLSCTKCRRRKLRCDRSLPACERCGLLGIECFYPERQPRKKKGEVGEVAPQDIPRREQGTLAAILERLQRVEAQTSARELPSSSTTPVAEGAVPVNTPLTSGASPPVCQSCGSLKQTGSPGSTDSGSLALLPQRGTLPESQGGSSAPFDVTSILSSAVGHVQQLRKKRSAGPKELATKCVVIPPDTARRWLDNYFGQRSGKIFPALTDRKLIYMMPDLLAMDHVQVDACMLLIYYCILWQGCFFKDNSIKRPDERYRRHIFVSCLRTIPVWQNEATGTITDFIAAVFTTQTATENLDFGLAWEMHKRACEYAQGLHLHGLDGDGGFGASNLSMSDEDRVNMWDLVQLDLFHRLVNNKPPAFFSNLNNWRVDLPGLSSQCPPDQHEAVPAMAFLARSRITFILINYFQTLENLEDDADALHAIGPLCAEVENIFEEWKIGEWLQTYQRGDLNAWVLCDLTLSCYSCLLFMLRKVTLPRSNEHRSLLSDNDDMIPRNALSMRAARRVVDILYHMVHTVGLPGPEALSCALGTYRAYVAYAHLASGLLHDPNAATVDEDLLRLTRFAECIRTVAQSETEFMPLARALNFVYNKVERRVSCKMT